MVLSQLTRCMSRTILIPDSNAIKVFSYTSQLRIEAQCLFSRGQLGKLNGMRIGIGSRYM